MWENVFWGVPNFKPTGVHWQNLVDQNINSMQVFFKGGEDKAFYTMVYVLPSVCYVDTSKKLR